jgi:hypothetical protein
MNKKLLITTISALVLVVAGGAFYLSQNSEMFAAQTAFKSYNYEDSLKVVEDFANAMPLTSNETGNKTFETEIDKLVANKTIKKQDDLFKVRAALFTGPENGIKVHIYNLKFKPTSYNCIYAYMENDDLLSCILLSKGHSLTTNYGGFVNKFAKNADFEQKGINPNTRETKIVNKLVQNMENFAFISEKVYNKLPKTRI